MSGQDHKSLSRTLLLAFVAGLAFALALALAVFALAFAGFALSTFAAPFSLAASFTHQGAASGRHGGIK